MISPSNPAWWTSLITLVLGALGVTDTDLAVAIKAVIVAMAGLVQVIYVIQHHKTTRNADNAAAAAVSARSVNIHPDAIAAIAEELATRLRPPEMVPPEERQFIDRLATVVGSPTNAEPKPFA